MSHQIEFLLVEYQELQAQFRKLVDDTVWLQRYIFFFSGAVWAWVFADPGIPLRHAAVWAPLSVTILFASKAYILHRMAGEIHEYTMKVEERMELEELGWLTWSEKNRKFSFVAWLLFFWGAVVFVNGFLGVYVTVLR